MRRRMMKPKIHRARVTAANPHYVGSVSIDVALMRLADILPNEQVAVLDVDNGPRFETYAIVGAPGEVCLNGAVGRLVSPGDRVILLTYADYAKEELTNHSLASCTSTLPTASYTKRARRSRSAWTHPDLRTALGILGGLQLYPVTWAAHRVPR